MCLCVYIIMYILQSNWVNSRLFRFKIFFIFFFIFSCSIKIVAGNETKSRKMHLCIESRWLSCSNKMMVLLQLGWHFAHKYIYIYPIQYPVASTYLTAELRFLSLSSHFRWFSLTFSWNPKNALRNKFHFNFVYLILFF